MLYLVGLILFVCSLFTSFCLLPTIFCFLFMFVSVCFLFSLYFVYSVLLILFVYICLLIFVFLGLFVLFTFVLSLNFLSNIVQFFSTHFISIWHDPSFCLRLFSPGKFLSRKSKGGSKQNKKIVSAIS